MDSRLTDLRRRFRTWRNVRKMRSALAAYERREWEDRHWRKHLKDGICIDATLHGMDVDNPVAFVQRHAFTFAFRPFHGDKPNLPALGKDKP